MALVRFGGGIVGMSGSIAGDTFARNRFGNYNRARTKPINPKSASQVLVRATLATLTARWSQVLTPVQRAAWNLYASSVSMKNRLGEAIFLTGFNHFIRSNANRVRLALTPVDDGPTLFELPAQDATFAVTASEATQNITAAYDATHEWCTTDGGLLVMFQGTPQNAQRNFFAGPWQLWTAVEGNTLAPPASPKIAPAVFAFAEDQRLWVYARAQAADGRLSEVFRASCFCDA